MKDKQIKEQILSSLIDFREIVHAYVEAKIPLFSLDLEQQIINLIERTNNTHESTQWNGILYEAKSLEKKIDTYLASQGKSSIGITWPKIL